MPKGVFVVYSSPSSIDAEEKYNIWYNEVHFPDLLDIPGIVSARRFVLSDAQMGLVEAQGAHRYLAIYELEADNLQQVLDEIGLRAADGRMRLDESIDMSVNQPLTYCYDHLASALL